MTTDTAEGPEVKSRSCPLCRLMTLYLETLQCLHNHCVSFRLLWLHQILKFSSQCRWSAAEFPNCKCLTAWWDLSALEIKRKSTVPAGTKILQCPLQDLPAVASRREPCPGPSPPCSSCRCIREALWHFGFDSSSSILGAQPWQDIRTFWRDSLERIKGKLKQTLNFASNGNCRCTPTFCHISCFLSLAAADGSLHKLLEVIERKESNLPVHQAWGGFILYWGWEKSTQMTQASGSLPNYCGI